MVYSGWIPSAIFIAVCPDFLKTKTMKTKKEEQEFQEKREEAKKDFDKAVELYKSEMTKAKTWEERRDRINRFRGG